MALFDWCCSDASNNKRWIKTDKRISNFSEAIYQGKRYSMNNEISMKSTFSQTIRLANILQTFKLLSENLNHLQLNLYNKNWQNTLKTFNWVGLLFYMVSSWLSKAFCYKTYFTVLQSVFYRVTKRILPC